MIVLLCFFSGNCLLFSEKKGKLQSLNNNHYQCSCSENCKKSGDCCPFRSLCSNKEKNFVQAGNFTFDSYEGNLNPEIENRMENTENSFNDNQEIQENINSETLLANSELFALSDEIRNTKFSSVEEVKRRLKAKCNLSEKNLYVKSIQSKDNLRSELPKLDAQDMAQIVKATFPINSKSAVNGTFPSANAELVKPLNINVHQVGVNTPFQKLNETFNIHNKLLDKTNFILESINKSYIDENLARDEFSQTSQKPKANLKGCLSLNANQLKVTVKPN